MTLNRREFVQLAAAMGASLAWGGSARASTTGWHERRDLYPEGVASGDPDPSSVILWTRRPFESGGRRVLTVEVAEDDAFRRVVATASAPVSAESDWTTRVLVGRLKPARVYWYRFTDGEGNGSRVGRTITAPLANDPRPVNFAFVSCQSVNEGRLNGYRRMLFEDERAAPADQLGFVLHLGDFIYEVVVLRRTRGCGGESRQREVGLRALGLIRHNVASPSRPPADAAGSSLPADLNATGIAVRTGRASAG